MYLLGDHMYWALDWVLYGHNLIYPNSCDAWIIVPILHLRELRLESLSTEFETDNI